jgi:hypothetical protein
MRNLAGRSCGRRKGERQFFATMAWFPASDKTGVNELISRGFAAHLQYELIREGSSCSSQGSPRQHNPPGTNRSFRALDPDYRKD